MLNVLENVFEQLPMSEVKGPPRMNPRAGSPAGRRPKSFHWRPRRSAADGARTVRDEPEMQPTPLPIQCAFAGLTVPSL